MTERRSRGLFIAALVLQLGMLTLQVPDPLRHGNFLESLGLRVIAPVSRVVDAGADGASGFRDSLRRRTDLLEENHRLLAELERMRVENMRLQDLDDEARRLAAALDYSRISRDNFRVADVVYADHRSWLRTLLVRMGTARAQVNQAVVSTSGLVGRVVSSSGPYARVQIITDRAAAVGAMLESTRRQGVVRGDGANGLEMDYVPLQAQVAVGDRVVTAGIEGVYPRGILIGIVSAVAPGRDLSYRIALAPAVDFGTLDQVFIIDREPLSTDQKEFQAGARP